MTPRTVRGSDGNSFARQLAERNASSQPPRSFRSSAAPKGTKLAAGYRDRTLERVEAEQDDKAARIKALEEQMKLRQIDSQTFEQLRDQITGGDISATHLVKGLDRQLLERVWRGEDVLEAEAKKAEEGAMEPDPDVDEEFEKLEEKEVAPMAREKAVKKGDMAPPPPVAGTKRTRDAILAEFKASRRAAAEAKVAARPNLGPKFRKMGEIRETSRIERDERGREVLITVDEDGRVKRKVKKVKVDELDASNRLLMPNKELAPLGMEVPDLTPAPSLMGEDDDIFEGVGHAYNPLGDTGDEDDSSSEKELDEVQKVGKTEVDVSGPQNVSAASQPSALSSRASTTEPEPAPTPMVPPPALAAISEHPQITARNYFGDAGSSTATAETAVAPVADPTFLAALKKAGRMDALQSTDVESEDVEPDVNAVVKAERLKRRAAMLASADRDMDDMDLGFGSSRFGDEEDAEGGPRIKLSKWKGTVGDDDDEDGKGPGKGSAKRKRGPKTRKGDKDSAADVLRVMEARKAAGK
ncbi:hypothetical protein B0A49_06093 [Cryomyces minteri]|uniref:RED-like N-terminal domain-containing protein n=1 Tax=Cryomyces minteri TaxID=331657 RepID=A0A4U0XNF0_9PEZI|nr:hypothetical protein B0A49_06093 [Cryomyces minteri]